MEDTNNQYKSQNAYDVTIKAVDGLHQKIDKFKEDIPKKTIFLGFDGYIDSLYSMVSEREDADNWKRMASMKEFGTRINDTAGSSCNIERVLKKRLAGGFAPNMARAISHFGSNVILAAAMGLPNVDPLFTEFPKNVELLSISNHGETAGFEFDDGKVMATDFGNINAITWDTIMKRIPRDDFIKLIESSSAIGQGHWSLMPNMNNYWSKLIEEIFPNVSDTKNKVFMVDVADLKKRTNKDINEMLKLLQKIDEFMPTMLSMNDRETIDISNVLSADDSVFEKKRISPIKAKEDYVDFGERLNEILNLSYVVTHDPHFATITTKNKHLWVTEGFTSKPKFTTGAGDHFNGATLLGLVCGLEPEEALVVGNALTAIFVRTGVSMGIDAVKNFSNRYTDFIVNDLDNFEM